jgi:hypothetical protein
VKPVTQASRPAFAWRAGPPTLREAFSSVGLLAYTSERNSPPHLRCVATVDPFDPIPQRRQTVTQASRPAFAWDAGPPMLREAFSSVGLLAYTLPRGSNPSNNPEAR